MTVDFLFSLKPKASSDLGREFGGISGLTMNLVIEIPQISLLYYYMFILFSNLEVSGSAMFWTIVIL